MKKITHITHRQTIRQSLHALLTYRELIFFFVWRDLLVRYKQTAIGAAWLFLRPLALLFVLWAVLGNFDRFSAGNQAAYAIMLICGLLPWLFFSTAVADAANALIGDSNLVAKVYFPRMCLPIASVLVSLVDFLVLVGVCAAIGLVTGFQFAPRSLLVLPLMALAVVAAVGVGLILSILSARYRDFRYVTAFLVQFGMFVSPVIYLSGTVVPDWLAPLYFVNPMAGIIESIRWSVLGVPIDPSLFLVSVASAVSLFVAGVVMFLRMEQSIADVV
jgi:lipopolysaccharide transport system permease protein